MISYHFRQEETHTPLPYSIFCEKTHVRCLVLKKYTIDEVSTIFESNNCSLISTEYINSKVPLDYQCVCGNKSKISLNSFLKGSRCRKCSTAKQAEKQRHTYDFIKTQFDIAGCQLISTEYTGNKQLLDYLCSCGTKARIRFNDFSRGVRCENCKLNKLSSLFRHDFDFVKEYFRENNCLLLSTSYKNSTEKLKYICTCGNIALTNFSAFQNGTRCRECGTKKIKEKQKFDYHYVYSYFKDQGCTLLSTEYINCMELLVYICSCGNTSQISFNNFQDGHRCINCCERRQLNYEFVKDYFEEQGCKLISTEYICANSKLIYECVCGNVSSIRFPDFENGRRCRLCSAENNKGENNHNWKGGISSLNKYLRYNLAEWKKASMKASNYKCVITGRRFDDIHHLYGFDLILDEVLKNTSLPLQDQVNKYSDDELMILKDECIRLHEVYGFGVCLTEEVHDLFHLVYGYGKNTPQQFEEFKRRYLNGEFENVIISA